VIKLQQQQGQFHVQRKKIILTSRVSSRSSLVEEEESVGMEPVKKLGRVLIQL
jgi:hypothetical protein